MSTGTDSSKFRDFTRGGQTTIHGILMFLGTKARDMDSLLGVCTSFYGIIFL